MKKNIFVRIALEKDLVWEVLLSGDPGFKIGGRNSSRLSLFEPFQNIFMWR